MPAKKRQVELDEALVIVGGFGKFQVAVLALLLPLAMFQGARMTANYFLLYTQDHRCAIPGYANDTYWSEDTYDHQARRNESIPEGDLGQCYVYDPNFVYDLDSYNRPINGSDHLVECSRWVYDPSEMRLTATAELDLVCDKAIYTSHTNLLLFVGSLMGAVVFGYVADKIGRKKCLLLSALVYLASGVAMAWSPDFAALAIFEILGGAASTGLSSNAFVMGLELVEGKHRRVPGLIYVAFFPVGEVLTGALAFAFKHWKWLELVITLPAVVCLTYYWLVPESLRWLMVHKKYDEVGRVLHRMAKRNGRELPGNAQTTSEMAGLLESFKQEEYGDSPLEVKELTPSGDSFWHVFRSRALAVRVLVICYNWFMIMMVFYGFVFNSDKLLAGNIFLNFILGAIVELPAHAITLSLVEKLGRKSMHCGLLSMAILASAAAIPCVYEVDEEHQWVVLMLSCIGKFGAAGTMGTSFLWSTELLPTSIRGTGLGIANMFGRLGAIAATYIVSQGASLGTKTGQALPFIVFCVASLSTLVLLILFLPETLGKRLPANIEEAQTLVQEEVAGYRRLPADYGAYKEIN